MKCCIASIISLLCFLFGSAQSATMSLGVSGGISRLSATDRLINTHIYSGITPWQLQVAGSVKSGKGLWLLRGSATFQRLKDRSASELYVYNYTAYQGYKMTCFYLRNVSGKSSSWQMYVGGAYGMEYYLQGEHYQSLLLESAHGFRRSFLYSPASIAVCGAANYRINSRQWVHGLISYGFISVINRPTDNSVKQLGLSEASQWYLLYGRKHVACQLELLYARQVLPQLKIIVMLRMHYRYDHYQDACAFRDQAVLAGFEKSF